MNQIVSNEPSASAEPSSAGPVFTPAADVLEQGDTVVLLLDMPGADPSSFDVTLDKRLLTISARVPPVAPNGYVLAHQEFGAGTYGRSFVFSEQMDGDRIDANLKDGVLRVSVAKMADTTAKKISVKTE